MLKDYIQLINSFIYNIKTDKVLKYIEDAGNMLDLAEMVFNALT